MSNIAQKKIMKEIQIKDYEGTICIDSNGKRDKVRVAFLNEKGYPDSHYIFNQENLSHCSSLTYIREGGRTRFYFNGIEIHPSECDFPVSSGSLESHLQLINMWETMVS